MHGPSTLQRAPTKKTPRVDSALRIAWFYDIDACRGATGVTRHALAQRAALARRPDVQFSALSGRITDDIGRDEWHSWSTTPRRTLPLRTRDMLRLWRLAGIPSVNHWTGPVDWIYCPAEYLIPASNARLAVTSHDVLQDLTTGNARRRALLDRVFHRADCVLSVSSYNTNHLHEAFPQTQGKTSRVPNAPDDFFFNPATADERSAVRPRLGLPPQLPYLLSVANFQPRKNLERLLRAVGRLTEFDSGDLALVLVGEGSPEQTQVIDRAIQALGPRARVVRPGYVSGTPLRALYAEATALVFPSTCESFGIPAVEAMAQNCPVALANSTALPEIAESAGWYFNPLDEDSLTDTLRSLLDNPSTCRNRIQQGRLRVDEFRWTRSCDLLVSALRATR